MKPLYDIQQVLIILLLCTIVGISARSDENTRFSEKRAEYNEICRYFNAEKTWKDVPEEEIAAVFRRLWSLVGAWAATYLEETSHATANEITHKIEELGYVNAHTIQLSPTPPVTYAISADFSVDDFPVNGTFFILTCTETRHCQVAWNIKELAQTHYASGDEIGYWAYFTFPFIGYGGGALIGYVSELPPTKTGNPRFYVEAVAAAHGGTHACQLSIWEWNGRDAIPVIIQSYHSSESTGDIVFDGTHLIVPIKEEYYTLMSCGNCPGATVIWTIGVTPTGVENLGRVYENPEMKLVDDLWVTILQGKNAEHLASSHVIHTLQTIIDDIGLEVDGSLGQGGGEIIETTATNRTLYWGADELGCNNALFFTIENRGVLPYIADIHVGDDCHYQHHETWERIRATEGEKP